MVLVTVLILAVLRLSRATLPMNCRHVVRKDAKTPLACVMITRTQIDGPSLTLDTANWGTVGQLSTDTDTSDNAYNDLLMPWLTQPSVSDGKPDGSTGIKNPSTVDAMTAINPDALPGACRWDLERSNTLGSDEACLCPATETTCTKGRKGCYWYEIPDSNALDIPTFACINTAERFYHLLAKLLKKRGKKDFAIKIRYGATPARGQLPLGPYGPAIIGGGSHNKMALALQQLGRGMINHFGGQQSPYPQSPYPQSTYPQFPYPPSPHPQPHY